MWKWNIYGKNREHISRWRYKLQRAYIRLSLSTVNHGSGGTLIKLSESQNSIYIYTLCQGLVGKGKRQGWERKERDRRWWTGVKECTIYAGNWQTDLIKGILKRYSHRQEIYIKKDAFCSWNNAKNWQIRIHAIQKFLSYKRNKQVKRHPVLSRKMSISNTYGRGLTSRVNIELKTEQEKIKQLTKEMD